MKGLLYKDLLLTWKAYRKNFVLVLLIYGTMAYVMEMDFFWYVLIFMLGMYCSSALACDENSQWDAYACTLPVTPGQLVSAKYLLCLAYCLLAFVLAAAGTMATHALHGASPADVLGEAVLSCLIVLAITLFYNAFTYPLSYKYGSDRARSATLLTMGGLFLLIFLLSRAAGAGKAPLLPAVDLSAVTERDLMVFTALMLALALLVYLASWAISTAIYRRKEY